MKKSEDEGETLSVKLEDFKERLSKLEKIRVEKSPADKFMQLLLLYIAFLKALIGLKIKIIGKTQGQEQEVKQAEIEAAKASVGEKIVEVKKTIVEGEQKKEHERREARVREKPRTKKREWKRILEERTDEIKQHYWVRLKKRGSKAKKK